MLGQTPSLHVEKLQQSLFMYCCKTYCLPWMLTQAAMLWAYPFESKAYGPRCLEVEWTFFFVREKTRLAWELIRAGWLGTPLLDFTTTLTKITSLGCTNGLLLCLSHQSSFLLPPESAASRVLLSFILLTRSFAVLPFSHSDFLPLIYNIHKIQIVSRGIIDLQVAKLSMPHGYATKSCLPLT